MTDAGDSPPEPQPDAGKPEPKVSIREPDAPDEAPAAAEEGEAKPEKRSTLRELAILAVIAVVLSLIHI